MSKICRSIKIDRNRYAKIYPFLHRVPVYAYINDSPISYEIGEVCFSGSDSITYTFGHPRTTIPTIVITPIGDDINVWIESVGLNAATFRSSVPTNACVSFQIVDIS